MDVKVLNKYIKICKALNIKPTIKDLKKVYSILQ